MLARLLWSALVGATLSQSACRAAPETAAPAPVEVREEGAQAISWLGTPLVPRALDDEVRDLFERNLADARRGLQDRPTDPEAKIWVGRRLAYLGRFDEAIEVYSQAIEEHPDHAALYRHRGHRYITTRRLGAALADFERAARLIEGTEDAVEPDGLPNAKNLPRSTLHTNVWYHLGLVHYLRGDFVAAERAYRACLERSQNDDMRVATVNWLYMALVRQDRRDDALAALAPIRDEMDVIENQSYHHLALMYLGRVEEATLDMQNPGEAYGVAIHALARGDADRAYGLLRTMVQTMRWDAFGTIAAEADLARRNPFVVADGAVDVSADIDAWVLAWKTYDLDAIRSLFLPDARLTYFSSEKPGRIQGIDAIVEHHRGFGFVPGGKPAEKELWVDAVHAEPHGSAVIVTGTWFFGTRGGKEKPQEGPFTFVYVSTPRGVRIAHAHFSNAPVPKTAD